MNQIGQSITIDWPISLYLIIRINNIFMKYLKKFDEHSKYAQFIETDEFIKPNVSGCEFGDEVHYNDEEHDYSKDYLTFTALEDGTFTLTIPSGLTTSYLSYIEYSLDEGETWIRTDNADNTVITITTPTIKSEESVFWRGSGIKMAYDYYNNRNSVFSSTGHFNVSGNLNTLLKLNHPEELVSTSYMFTYLFNNVQGLVDASQLVLPLMTIDSYSYQGMFKGCTSLTTAPVLPATTLQQNCYSEMFYGCTSLTTAPVLPAITLYLRCYSYMFYGCTSLVTTPELPATTLASTCYSYMFCGCTSLISAPALPATEMKSNCYEYMFKDCTRLITPPILSATTLGNNFYQYMFYGCTSLTSCPELPATELKQYCYNGMFENCTSIKHAPALPATILQGYCYYYMFYECTSLENVPELNALELVSYCYGYMFTGCSKINYAKALFTTRPDAGDGVNNWLTDAWLARTSTTGIFVKNINATWPQNSQTGIPTTWTILYFDPSTEKYYLSDKTTECDDHGNVI